MKARCPLHLNLTSALLDTLSDMQQQIIRLFAQLDAGTFWRRVEALRTTQTAPGAITEAGPGSDSGGRGKEGLSGSWASVGRVYDEVARYRHREVAQVKENFCLERPADTVVSTLAPTTREFSGASDSSSLWEVRTTERFRVCHEFSATLPLEARMSFTILNMTGQRMRYFQPRAGEETRRLQYLRVRKGFHISWGRVSEESKTRYSFLHGCNAESVGYYPYCVSFGSGL